MISLLDGCTAQRQLRLPEWHRPRGAVADSCHGGRWYRRWICWIVRDGWRRFIGDSGDQPLPRGHRRGTGSV